MNKNEFRSKIVCYFWNLLCANGFRLPGFFSPVLTESNCCSLCSWWMCGWWIVDSVAYKRKFFPHWALKRSSYFARTEDIYADCNTFPDHITHIKARSVCRANELNLNMKLSTNNRIAHRMVLQNVCTYRMEFQGDKVY